MPARNPLVHFIRRIVKLETSAHAFSDNYLGSYTNFTQIPATAVAATSDPEFLLSGVNTETCTRAPKGGIRLGTSAVAADSGQIAGAPNTNMGLASAAANNFLLVSTTAEMRFSCQVSPVAITAEFISAGLNEFITDVDPAGTAGDGAMFLFVPSANVADLTVNPGVTTAQFANWICHFKVAGVDTFTATSVPVVAGTDYQLEIVIPSDKKPRFYIDNQLVFTATTAMTSAAVLAVVIGIEVATAGAAAKTMDIRYVKVQRTIA